MYRATERYPKPNQTNVHKNRQSLRTYSQTRFVREVRARQQKRDGAPIRAVRCVSAREAGRADTVAAAGGVRYGGEPLLVVMVLVNTQVAILLWIRHSSWHCRLRLNAGSSASTGCVTPHVHPVDLVGERRELLGHELTDQ